MKLCVDCKYYLEIEDYRSDECTHERAAHGGVREVEYYTCSAMRAGVCGPEARLFEEASHE